MIVYHTYLIKRGYDEFPARRDDFTYYFNLETKLTEKITGVQYNENHEVLSTYENIFTYDVKEYFSPTLYENIINAEKNIKLEIMGEVGAPWGSTPSKQQIWANVVATWSLNSKGLDKKSPRTRPKCIDGKKSFKSILTIHLLRQ